MSAPLQCQAGEPPLAVFGCALRCGADWSVTLAGGTLPHVGAVALAQYEPARDSATVSVLTAYTHRDDAVASATAKRLAAALKCSVSAAVGLHVDNAGAGEIAALRENAAQCVEALLRKMEANA